MGFEKFFSEKIFKKESKDSHIKETGDPFIDVYKLLKLNNAFSQIEVNPNRLKKEKAPIKADQVFDPQKEISKILHWDSRLKDLEESQASAKLLENERIRKKEALEQFKQKLIYQQKGLSYLESFIIQKLYQNPDLPKSALLSDVSKFNKDYRLGLGVEQFSKIETLIEKYYELRRQIYNLFASYPSAESLFNYFFDQPAKDKIFVCFSPISLGFVCASQDDFKAIAKKAGYHGSDLDFAIRSIAAFCTELEGKVNVPVIAINGWRVKKELAKKKMSAKESEKNKEIVVEQKDLYDLRSPFWQLIAKIVYPHEERHVLDRLVIKSEIKHKLEEALRQKSEDKLQNLKLETDKLMSDLEIKKEFSKCLENFQKNGNPESFKKYFEWRLPSILEEAKTELLAYSQEPNINLRDPRQRYKLSLRLSLPREEGGLYDFLEIEKRILSRFSIENIEKNNQAFNFLNNFTKKYQHEIRQGIKSFNHLTSKLKYPVPVAAALLRSIPLSLWSKTVKRIEEIERPSNKKSK